MRWGRHGRISYMMHYGLIGQPIKHLLECHHTSLYMGKHFIYLLSLNSKPIGPSNDGTWILKQQEQKKDTTL
jgi:hypothetical protein